ncbi:MAG: hypothetical protein ACE5HT_16855 [Gemmatimonadales bacterium]
MPAAIAVAGALLILFGGGCVVAALMFGDYFADRSTVIRWGVLPLIVGGALVVWGLRWARRGAPGDS